MKKQILITATIALFLAPLAKSSVSFSLYDVTPPTTSVSISPGDTFNLTIDLITTSEQTTGVSYFLTASGPASSVFTIVTRNLTASPFTFLATDDVTALTPANALLNPQNNNDLGAGVANTNIPTAAGTNRVAILSISSTALTPVGNYTISLVSTDVVGLTPDFDPIAHTSNSYNVTVIPEPTTALLLALGALVPVLRRRRR